jgi:hypothetical protein
MTICMVRSSDKLVRPISKSMQFHLLGYPRRTTISLHGYYDVKSLWVVHVHSSSLETYLQVVYALEGKGRKAYMTN